MKGCFWTHDWGKWTDRNAYVNEKRGHIIVVQERVCSRCGKKQLRSTYSY